MAGDISRDGGGCARSPTAVRTIIGVMGPSLCRQATYEKARRLGGLLAKAGHVVLCGGGTGVMEAVARGASEAGGLTIGILPGHDKAGSRPNAFIQLPIYTGLSHARNLVNVLSSEVVVAVGGAHGTLSEIALAIKSRKPVVLLDSWRFEMPGGKPSPLAHRVESPEEAAHAVEALLGRAPG